MAAHPAAEGKGDDCGGTSQCSVTAERSTNCSLLVTYPASLHWPRPAFLDTRWHTGCSHVPDAQQIQAETFRVLRPGGQIAVSDSDYKILTMAIRSADPI